MSMAIAHFAVGTIGTLLLCRLGAKRACRSPTVLLAGGAWAIAPDVHWVLPVGSGVARKFHQSAITDLFWLHGLLDAVDPMNSRPLAGLSVVALLLVVVLVELSLEDPVDEPAHSL